MLYYFFRILLGLGLGFYYRRIERFHAENVPRSGPLLFTSNHPGSLTDSFLLGSAVPRKVHFVATVQLFRFRLVKWLLMKCGVIPINRLRDDPRGMRSVADTFEACYQVFERGEAVGIFPEGITYDDSRLKEIKTGAARMALEFQSRRQGKPGLRIVPVGLTLSAKEKYRSNALVNFGEPIIVAEFMEGYAERRKECIHRLTEELEQRLRRLIVDLPTLEQERAVEGVKRLYLEQLVEQGAFEGESLRVQELLLSQQVAETVKSVYRDQPERAAGWTSKLLDYEHRLQRLRLSEEFLKLNANRRTLAWKLAAWSFVLLVGAPVAIYGWVHRLVPFSLVKWAIGRFTEKGKQKAQTATVAIEAGLIAFGAWYGACLFVVHHFFGWPLSLWYGLSLPVTGILAHYYLRAFAALKMTWRVVVLRSRAPAASRRLKTLRASLLAEIESVAGESRAGNNRPGPEPAAMG